MRTGNFRILAVALATFSMVAISACSQVVDPVSDAEQLQLPVPGTYVARDRGGNVLATGKIRHSSETERIRWVIALTLPEPARSRLRTTGHVSTYSGPEPECSANMGDSQEELKAYGDCVTGLFADSACEVVVQEHFKASGDLHAHCEALH